MTRLNIPRESEEQIALFEWAIRNKRNALCLEWMFHIPNGGSRPKGEAAHLQLQGVKRGVPDVILPVPCGTYHGLAIEMKRLKGSKTAPEQIAWNEYLNSVGYKAVFANCWWEAAQHIIDYLHLDGKAGKLRI